MEPNTLTEQQPVVNQPSPSVQSAPVETPEMPLPVSPKKQFDLRYIFIAFIIIGVVGGVFMATRTSSSETPVPTPTETPTPTESRKREDLLPIATQSSYIEITKGIASLSAYLKTMQMTDTTLTPPTIELNLGFTNQ